MPFAGAVGYFGHFLAGPLLAAIVARPLIALTLGYLSSGREGAEHDARASELNEDMRRWVRDRDRQLEREFRTLVNQAGSGLVSRFPVPAAELPPPGTGSQFYSGALTNEAVAGMRQALHEYRDEATPRSGNSRRWHAVSSGGTVGIAVGGISTRRLSGLAGRKGSPRTLASAAGPRESWWRGARPGRR